MFDVMIIDDDTQVRERLKSIIDWTTLPIRLVCEAGDSDSAMELFLMYRPKIIITDISIPIISGLDLALLIQKEDPEIQFIVITGFNDFELVRRSVNVGAIDLLSKPIFPEAINKSLKKAVEHFLRLQEECASGSALKRLVSKNLPQMQETFMINLINRPQEDISKLNVQMKLLEIPCTGPFFAMILLAIPFQKNNEMEYETPLMLLRDTLSSHFKAAEFQFFVFIDTHSRVNCLVSLRERDADNTIEEILMRTYEQMQLLAGTKILVGIGPTVDTLMRLNESRRGALTALNYQCILGSASVMHFKNMEKMDTVFHSQETIHTFLLQKFRECDLESISNTLQNHIAIIYAYGNAQNERVAHFLFEYVQNITNEALRLGLTLDKIEAYVPTIVHLMQTGTPRDCVEDVLRLTKQFLEHVSERHTNESNHLISIAKEYIMQNLDKEQLNLEAVSDHVGLSRIYFCKLFHQVEGITFSNYLKCARVEKAKHLLLNTNMKAFEISDAVAFSNAKYFSFAFKQIVGLSPMEYQKQFHR